MKNEPAFPVIPPDSDVYKGWPATVGLTKLEYIATAALQGLLADTQRTGSANEYTKFAVECAEALLAEIAAHESNPTNEHEK